MRQLAGGGIFPKIRNTRQAAVQVVQGINEIFNFEPNEFEASQNN